MVEEASSLQSLQMAILSSKLFVLSLIVLSSVAGGVQSRNFDELFQASWALDHVINEGEQLKLKLDTYSGAGFASKSKYMYGKTTVQIKLAEGDSAGTVTAFYMSSEGPNHHEFDFEFLGNTSGEPVLVQTNIYVNGVGNREQRNSLWFDPTKDFHSYSILWNKRQVIFMVDETPIRVYTNREKQGIPFPKEQAMGVYSSIWNADDWATQGGRVKTDWSHAPFVSSYRGFEIDGCECPSSTTMDENTRRCSSSSSVGGGKGFWWDEPVFGELSVHQSHQLMWVRANHMIYDYCADSGRFPVLPQECVRHQHH
ncbi:hypothetical protein Sjap_003425 [Stephania japonica]|uniref:Xyloglucan endotransglucosylase/hydrolase n=1 Tax=Stephania japonica TaxID=461633 RepID=A0AAP0KPP1_9MAGN